MHFDLTPEQRAIRDLALDFAEREIVPRRRTSSSVFAKTDPDARAKGISAFLVERSSCGLEVGAEYPVEKLLRDAKVILYEGTSEIQRNIIARELSRRHASTTRTRRARSREFGPSLGCRPWPPSSSSVRGCRAPTWMRSAQSCRRAARPCSAAPPGPRGTSPPEVRGNHRVPVVVGQLVNEVVTRDPGAGDEEVEIAELVGRSRDAASTCRGWSRRRNLEPAIADLIEIGYRNCRSVRSEARGGGRANPLCAARDQRDLSLETHSGVA